MTSPRGLQDQIKQFLDSFKPGSQSQAQAAAGPSQAPCGHITTTSGGTSGPLTVSGAGAGSIGGAGILTTTTLPTQLTQAEQQELETLRADFKNEVKKARLDIFKGLPSAIRQSTIDAFEWENCRQTMNSIAGTMGQRLQELTNKEQLSTLLSGFSHSSLSHYLGQSSWHYSEGNAHIAFAPTLPDGITLEDLKIAHVEATMEESIQNEPTNS